MFDILIQITNNIIKLLFSNKETSTDNQSSQKVIDTDNRFGKSTIVVHSQPTPDFRFGMNQAWIMFQLALFKMYRDDKLLDYDSLFIELSNNLESISSSTESLKQWNEEYLKYIQTKDNKPEF